MHNKTDLIDKKAIATILGYSTTRSVDTLAARRSDFPAPAVVAVGRGHKTLWKYSDIAEWFKAWKRWEHAKS